MVDNKQQGQDPKGRYVFTKCSLSFVEVAVLFEASLSPMMPSWLQRNSSSKNELSLEEREIMTLHPRTNELTVLLVALWQ